MAIKRFEKLLEPGYIGKVRTRNRLVKTGAGTFMWNEDEIRMNKAILAYYESLARGGVGLLIVESPTIDYPAGARWRQRYRLDDDKYIKGLSELPKLIHQYGCPTFMQMNHDGPWDASILGGDSPFKGPPIGASPTMLKNPNDFHNTPPHELTIPEIKVIIDKFASAAVRAKKAGFDGVDVNAASSHLLHNFLSPFWNRRKDAYGGNPENRARIVTNIIKEIKKRSGQDFPVSVCINGIEIGQAAGVSDEKCIMVEDAQRTAQLLEAAGADLIHVRSHWLGYHVGAYLPDLMFYPAFPVPLKDIPEVYDTKIRGKAWNVNLAAGIKAAVKIPVMVVGKLDPELGEKVLEEGKADFIAMTRRLQADPDLPNKVAAGRLEDIAPCTACENCLGSRRCRINTFMGKEYNSIEKANNKKSVAVVGAGPAGMEAARVAALRGHDVMLFDGSGKLGGLLPVAAVVKGTELEDLPAIIKYFKRQLKQLGVKMMLGKKVNTKTIESIKPDTVIIATGGTPTLPDIKGINDKNVIGGVKLHKSLKFYLKFIPPNLLRWLTKFYLPIGKRVVIIGGSLHGCELGEFLVKRGRQVTIVEKSERLGEGMVDVIQAYLFQWFRKNDVRLISGVKEYVEITKEGLTIINKDGKKETLEADTIVPALPLTPDLKLYESLKGKIKEVYAIGDCKEPLLIVDAISQGMETARAI
jgi:2,4-dienoyl-CoA reductase (NADPH2)